MDTELDAEPAHYAQIVQRSSERLMRLVEDILEFSGLEAHQTVLRPRPFGVRAARLRHRGLGRAAGRAPVD